MTQNQNEIFITEDEAKTCRLDGKIFPSSRLMIWHIRKTYNLDFEHYILKAYYNDIRPVCLKTGNPLSFKGSKLGPFFHNYSKNAFPRKPHTEEAKEKIKAGCEKTSMEKYGVKNVFSTDWCKDKIKATMISKYGVDNIMKLGEMQELFSTFIKSPEAILKCKATLMEKYGEDHYFKTPECKIGMRKKAFFRLYSGWDDYVEKLGENCKMSCESTILNIENGMPLEFKCNLCSHKWVEPFLIMPVCPECEKGFRNSRSKEEASLMSWLSQSIEEPILSNKRFNKDGKIYEADIVIEDKKLVIEFNGLFWHGERCGKDKDYHNQKYNFFRSLGYDVIQIFEDEWVLKTELVKKKLLHKLGYNKSETIYARDCVVAAIQNKESNDFLNKTHIQGGTNASYCYGAYYQDELVAVMTFSPLRKCTGDIARLEGSYEIVRFSTSLSKRVVGIAGKLLSVFIKDYSPQRIISYADRRWTNEAKNLYDSIGMKLIGITAPNYWYVKKFRREHRFKYTKQKLIKMGNDPALTERAIMQSLGYDRIWDCGHFKYEWTSTKI